MVTVVTTAALTKEEKAHGWSHNFFGETDRNCLEKDTRCKLAQTASTSGWKKRKCPPGLRQDDLLVKMDRGGQGREGPDRRGGS